MCTCASCEYTDRYAGLPDLFGELEVPAIASGVRSIPSFQAWPRGEPKGSAASGKEYRDHAKHCGADGLPKPWSFKPGQPPRFNTAGLVLPIAPAPKMVRDWINARGPLWGEASPTDAEPARPAAPCKARQHFPGADRGAEAGNDGSKSAIIYSMQKKEKQKRSRGRPELPGRRVVVKLEEAQIKRAEKIGAGNVAAGIRKALSG